MGYKKSPEQVKRATRAKFLLAKLHKAGVKDVKVAAELGCSALSVYLWRAKGRAPDEHFLEQLEKMAKKAPK
ncbi:MAG: hypothetical protein WC729_29490 [Sphingomonas sp.]|jgi:hypothetical protein|uniref:hypothetical protein n=1 Tax=Sphingomonas sp. TaxID=28214 RepID=UPI003566FCF0